MAITKVTVNVWHAMKIVLNVKILKDAQLVNQDFWMVHPVTLDAQIATMEIVKLKVVLNVIQLVVNVQAD